MGLWSARVRLERAATISVRSVIGGRANHAAHGPHRYFFRLCALAREPAVAAGPGGRELERALAQGTIAVAELIGRYQG